MVRIKISVIIPCYNEGETFEQSVKKIISVLEKTAYSWEIIFVEDKSSDNTGRTVKKLVQHLKKVRAIFHTKNMGRGRSVSDGINAAKGDICGYLDVDLEVSSKYIPLFIKEVQKGADLVVGNRFYENSLKSLSRVAASRIYAQLVKILFSLSVADSEAGYKFFNRKKVLPILEMVNNNHWFWDTELCVKANIAGLRIEQIPVLFVRRSDKKSTVKLFSDTYSYIRELLKLKLEIQKIK